MIRAIARLAVDNPVAVNLAMLAVCAAGLLTYAGMPREVFPDFALGRVEVATLYPGASPEDVERLVTLPLEGELEALDGLDRMTSRSQEGLSTISLDVETGADLRRFLDDVRSAVDRDLGFPDEVEEPLVREIESEFPAIAVLVYGDAPEDVLRERAERVERDLERLPGVGSVRLTGTREHRLWVEVDPLALERLGLTLAQVGRAVGARSRDLPLGSLSTERGDWLLRVESGVTGARDLLELPVLARPDGAVVRLRDVARPVDTFERPVTLARFNGKPSLHLQVNKEASGDTIDVAAAVREYLRAEREHAPDGVALGVNSDLSVYVRNRLDTMQESAAIGGVLVLLSLVLFLSRRVALITALGIPVAFLGGLVLAGLAGITMSMITMFALIVVLGMIVDDAIVIAENAYRLMEEGVPPVEAAVRGTAEVGVPVTATILTTMAAFLPILLVPGTIGKFMAPLPLVVTFCLAASLIEAVAVMPAHLAHWVSHRRAERATGAPARRRWYDPLRDGYAALLARAVRWRWVTLALAGTGTAVLAALASAFLPFHLFDEFESKVFQVNLRARAGASLEETERLARWAEERVLAMPPEEVESANTLVGIQAEDATRWQLGQNLAQVWVELREGGARERSTAAVIADLRERLAGERPPDLESVAIAQPQAGPTGRAIDVSIRGPDLDVLRGLAREALGVLERLPGVRDPRDNAQFGKREIRVRLTDAGRLLGFTEEALAAELRAAFEGTRFARLRRGRDDVEVVVKLPEELRGERAALEELRVGVPSPLADLGGAALAGGVARVPLSSVAELVETRGPEVITRDEGRRSVRVLADVDKAVTSADRVVAALEEHFADLDARHPGYALAFQGDHEDTRRSLDGLGRAALFSLIAIYMILGSLFRSFLQPLVILLALPLGITGMVLGHLVMGRDLSMMSMIGLLALSGVVVNDSLILVDLINVKRRAGRPLVAALVEAGAQRFRPIVLTSITTMLGLAPLALFATGQARFLQPMAITLFYGLAAATLLILIVVPCGYAALEDLIAVARAPRRALPRLARGEPLHDAGPA